eukprot:COSAG02_NODE_1960_length_10257_cov_48.153278_6_plen_1221_part_00
MHRRQGTQIVCTPFSEFYWHYVVHPTDLLIERWSCFVLVWTCRERRSLFSRSRSKSRNGANSTGKSPASVARSTSVGSINTKAEDQQQSSSTLSHPKPQSELLQFRNADANCGNENGQVSSRPVLVMEDVSGSGSGGSASASGGLDDTVAATATKTVAEERVEQLTAMHKQMTNLLEEEREHRKQTAAKLGNRTLAAGQSSMAPEKAPRGSVTATVRVRSSRVAELARRASPQRMRVRRSEAKGFGSSSPARVRKSSRGAGSAAYSRRTASPAAVPRVATLAACTGANIPKPRVHPNGAKKGFGVSGCRDTSPAVWSSSVKGTVPTVCSPIAVADKDEEDQSSRSPNGSGTAVMKPTTKAALRWMKSPTKSSAAKRTVAPTASAAATGTTAGDVFAAKRKTKKGFGSSASRGVGGSPQMQRHLDVEGRDEVLSGKVVDLINRLVPTPSIDNTTGGVESGSPTKNRKAKYNNPAKKGFGTSSPARLTNTWLAPEEQQPLEPPAIEAQATDDGKSVHSTGYETVEDWGQIGPDWCDQQQCEEEQDEDWGQREVDDALDSEEEQAKKMWNEAAQSEALLAEARQREKMAELHAVQKRLIIEIEDDPDNLSLLQNLAQVDKAMALAINAGAKPPSGRSPPQAKQQQQQQQQQQQRHPHSTRNEAQSPSRVERARRAAAQQEREDTKRRTAEHRHQREMERLEKARKDAERREAERRRAARAGSPATSRLSTGLSRLLRPKSASDSVSAAERRQKRIIRAKEEAQKDLTFQPQVPKSTVPPRQPPQDDKKQEKQQNSLPSSLPSPSSIRRASTKPEPEPDDHEPEAEAEAEAEAEHEHEHEEESEPQAVSDRLYRECAQRAQRRTTREEQQQAQELADCTFSPNISATAPQNHVDGSGGKRLRKTAHTSNVRSTVPVARRLDLNSSTSGSSLTVGNDNGSTEKCLPDSAVPELCGRMFDMVDIGWSGQLSDREINSFCAAMVLGAKDGDADVESANACAAALIGTCMTVVKANGSTGSMTKQQFMQTTPGDGVVSHIQLHYDSIIAFCRTMASDPARTERYVAAGGQMSEDEIDEIRCAVLPRREEPEEPADHTDVVSRTRTWQADRDAKLAERRAALRKRQEEEEKALYKPFRANPVPPPPPPAKNADRRSPKGLSPKKALAGSPGAAAADSQNGGSGHGRDGERRNRSPAQQRKAAAKLSGLEPSEPTLRQRRFLAEATVSIH